jgi:hypothetical protein
MAEGEVITPLLVARRFSLNPVLVILSLFFWYALWGIPGARFLKAHSRGVGVIGITPKIAVSPASKCRAKQTLPEAGGT